VADAGEPGGSERAGARPGDEDLNHGVGEDGGEGETTVDTARRAEKRQAVVLVEAERCCCGCAGVESRAALR
jgi:hypothetical protein